jgi:transposase
MPKQPPRDGFNQSSDLPDNLHDCHNLIKELFARVAELEKQLSRRNRAAFGKKSAKVDSTLLTGTGKAIHSQTDNELDAEKARLNIVPNTKHGGGRSQAPPSLQTRKTEHRLDETSLPCPCCKQPREIIGFDVSHQIEFVRSIFETIQHVMFKYACKNCRGQVVTAQKPYQPIDKGLPGPGLLAKIATDKFWLHLPLYRQEQVFTALTIPIYRSSMCRWLKGVADILAPIAKRMSRIILKSRVIQSDASTLPVIKKGLGKTHKGYVWVYRGDVHHPYVFYDYSDTEHSIYPQKILKGFTGILLTDGTNKFVNELELLKERRKVATTEFVFPGNGKSGHLVDPKRAWSTLRMRAGIEDCTIHDLRRSLGAAMANANVNIALVKSALHHKDMKTTLAVYARTQKEAVRDAREAVQASWLQAAEDEESKVVGIGNRKANSL